MKMNKYRVYREDDIVVKLKHLLAHLSTHLEGIVGMAPMNEWLYIYPLTNKLCKEEEGEILWKDRDSDANWFPIKHFNKVCEDIRTDWLNLYFSMNLEDAKKGTYYLKLSCIDGFYWEIYTDNNEILSNFESNSEGLIIELEKIQP